MNRTRCNGFILNEDEGNKEDPNWATHGTPLIRNPEQSMYVTYT